MLYESTRGSRDKMTGARAIIRGIAEDKGLYVPEEVPALPFDLGEMAARMARGEAGYKDVAFKVLGAFFDDFTDEEMQGCIDGASLGEDPAYAQWRQDLAAYLNP